MRDDELTRLFRSLADAGTAAADPEPAFRDQLFAVLERQAGHAPAAGRRWLLVLAAATLLVLLAVGGAIGSGFVRLPWLAVEPSPSADASPATSAAPSVTDSPPASSPTSPAPSARETPSPVTVGTFAEVVTTDLVVRSAPRISADSVIFAELDQPARVYVAEGPRLADGYRWFLVEIDQRYGGELGWVAAEAKDGEVWLQGLGHEPGKWVVESFLADIGARSVASGSDGRIYVFGQTLPAGPSSSVAAPWVYDTLDGTWRELPPMPRPLLDPRVAVADDGRVYALGGREFAGDAVGDPLRTVQIYDPRTNSWTVAADALAGGGPGATLSAVAASRDGTIYAFWTEGNGGGVTALDPTRDKWTEVGRYDGCIDDVTSGTRGQLLVLFGGSGVCLGGGVVAFANGEFLVNDAVSLRLPRDGASLASLAAGRLIVAGGALATPAIAPPPEVEQSYGLLSMVEVYDPASGTWMTLPPLASTGANGVATAGDQVYVVAPSDGLSQGSLIVRLATR